MVSIQLDPKKAIEDFEEMFDKYVISERKEAIGEMLFERNVSSKFYQSPASNSLNKHSAYDGGLVCHTVTVLKLLFNLSKTVNIRTTYGDESLFVAGAFHDLGKIGDGDEQFYLPETNDWWRNTKGRMYEYNKKLQYLPHSVRSIYILQEQNIPLSVDEFTAIMYHDGLYQNMGLDIKLKEPGLALALHFADMWAAFEIEQIQDPNNTAKDHRRF